MTFITPVLLVSVIGLLSAVILTLAAKFMAVPVDETVIAVREALPGANCGACGFAGCDDYASAVAGDPENVAANLCTPGGSDVSSAIASILGVDAGSATPIMAVVKCTGFNDKTKYEMEYQGYGTCASNKLFFKGRGTCKSGCLGFGDCADVCAYDAIEIYNGVAVVDKEKCVGCGMCSKACPNLLISMVPKSNRVYVGCSSLDTGKVTRQSCEVGCIACKLCEKACKFEAVKVEDNHAVIDPEKCKNCGLCVKACPRKVIYAFPRPAKPAAPKKEAPAKEGEAKTAAPKKDAPVKEGEVKPEAKGEKAVKAEVKSEAKAEPKADAKTETKAESKDAKAESKKASPKKEEVKEAAAESKDKKKPEEKKAEKEEKKSEEAKGEQKDSQAPSPTFEDVSENPEAAALTEEVAENKAEKEQEKTLND